MVIAGYLAYLVAFAGALDALKNLIKKTAGYNFKPVAVTIAVLVGFGYWATTGHDSVAGTQEMAIQADSGAIAKVRETQPDKIMVPGKTAPLHGGTVVFYDGAVYWVNESVVYAVNGIAKNWSPSIDYAPENINYSASEKAINQRYGNSPTL